MNFGKVKCLLDVLILNYYIKWGRFGPSKLGHSFFTFRICMNFGVIFAIESCKINQLNIMIHKLEICWRKTWFFLKLEKMPKIVLPISLQIDNSII